MSAPLRRLNYRYLILSLAVCILAAGCVESIPVGKFDALADSCQKILTGTVETYTRVEKMQRRYYIEKVATRDNKPYTLKTFLPSYHGRIDYTPELRFRESALKVLVKYVLALQALASRDFAGEVSKAIENLAGSLSSLESVIEKMKIIKAERLASAKQASGILSAVVKIIAKAVVDKMRLDALKAAMDKAQKGVAKLAKLLAEDDRNIKKRGYMTWLKTIVIRFRNTRGLRPPKGTPNRIAFDNEVALIICEGKAVGDSLDNLADALDQVSGAHAEIRKMLNGQGETKPDQRSPKKSALRELVKYAQRIGSFYRNLK